MAEAEKLAYADRAAWLGDPDFVKIPLAGLISKAYAEHLRALISPDRARPAADIRPGEPQRYESDQTTHFSIVDADGDAVANTYTLNLPYGSRPGRGRDRAYCSTTSSTTSPPSPAPPTSTGSSAATPMRRDR